MSKPRRRNGRNQRSSPAGENLPVKNPLRAPETPQPQRNVLCRHYADCLDHAARNRWEGFSCGNCGDYQVRTWTPEELQLDADCCVALLCAVFCSKITAHKLHRLLDVLEADRHWDSNYAHI